MRALLAAGDTFSGTASLNWSASLPISTWDGLELSESPSRVDALELRDYRLTGKIPEEFGKLSELRELTLSAYLCDDDGCTRETGPESNRLTGEIPSELGNLKALTNLDLGGNQLSGEIPSELSGLSNLTFLWLGGNQLTGAIPSELGNLTNLELLWLHSNNLSGEIPAELGDLSNLVSLSLGFNQLSGEIPSELGNLTSLEDLWLDDNQLSGEIPSELGNLTSLGWLSVYSNQLSGGIPSELGNLTSLERVNLSRNQLSGGIPSELGNLTNLVWLFMFSNQLSGEIPSELGNLTNLVWLRLSGNQLSGCIPSELRDVQTNDFDDLNLPFCDETATPSPTPSPTPEAPADECVGTVSGNGAITGSWGTDCASEGRSGSYASYHTFTLAESADVTITAESTVDTYLFLREGSGRDGTEVASNDDHADEADCTTEFERTTDSCIVHSLDAGTYTIEVSTYSAGETGEFTLTVGGLPSVVTPTPSPTPGPSPEPTPEPPADSCVSAVSGNGAISGSWDSDCASEDRSGSYASYHTFTLTESANVTITAESTVDTYLNLREGEGREGTILHFNDDHDSSEFTLASSTDSGISETLSAGTYTIEVSTYSAGETGDFTLTISGLPTAVTPTPEPTPTPGPSPEPTPTPTPDPPADECVGTVSGSGTTTGNWSSDCASEGRSGSYASYYTFTLAESADLTITAESTVDTYLNLRDGAGRDGTILHFNDDHDSSEFSLPSSTDSGISESLGAGSYMIEVTTYTAGETGDFTLTISGLPAAVTPTPEPTPTACVRPLL